MVAGHPPCGSGLNDIFSASVSRRLCLLLRLDLDTMSYADISWSLSSSPALKLFLHPFQKLQLAQPTLGVIQGQLVTPVFHSQSSIPELMVSNIVYFCLPSSLIYLVKKNEFLLHIHTALSSVEALNEDCPDFKEM